MTAPAAAAATPADNGAAAGIEGAAPAPRPVRRARRLRRALPWVLLVALLAVAQTLLVVLTVRYESWRAHAAAEAVAAEAASAVRRDLLRLTQALQAATRLSPAEPGWRTAVDAVLRESPPLRRIEWRDATTAVVTGVDAPLAPPLFARIPRAELSVEAEQACREARRLSAPTFSRSYFVPSFDGTGEEVLDLCLPVWREGREAAYLVATLALQGLLDEAAGRSRELRRYELSFVEADGARLARVGAQRGAGVTVEEQALDLPGHSLRLRADSVAGAPGLIPNLTLALVLGLSIALFGVVLLLVRDVRRRAAAEQAVAESLRFRQAMEDSLSTGLRARDLAGAITYVNPAFCAMVGVDAEALYAVRPPAAPPYWPPERAAEYAERQRRRLAGGAPQREGFEMVYMRSNGERFPVMVYEAPLLDGEGRHTGWMGSVLDLTAQRRMEDLSRQQQERLQASARLATVGEMASLLSHELNQPLAAIASYSTGSLNLLDAPLAPGPVADAAVATEHAAAAAQTSPGDETTALLRQALARITEQAERAGRVIKSVHDFVRRREQQRETIGVDPLLDAVLPLVRLQARKAGVRVEVDLPQPPAAVPRVVCDRTMVEQVLLNLARNGIQAMEGAPGGTPAAERVLRLAARVLPEGRVQIEVGDRGPGIAPEVAARLFTPFFTTRAEGMGLGLSLCRTVIEQHGGALAFGPGAGGRGTLFCFTLPAPRPAAAAGSNRRSAGGTEGEHRAEASQESGDTGLPAD